MPKKSKEQLIRVFLKPSESDAHGDKQKCQDLWEAFQEWFKEKLQKVPLSYKLFRTVYLVFQYWELFSFVVTFEVNGESSKRY